jgi:hypothetical protein
VSRRWRYPRSRRGQIWRAVPQPSPPPAALQHRRVSTTAVRRGRFWVVVPAPVIIAPPRPPDSIGHDRTRLAAARRGRFTAVPQPTGQSPVSQRARSRWVPATRRGRYFTVPLTVVAPAPPPWVPPITSTRRPAIRHVRRGRFLGCPTVQQPPRQNTRRRPSGTPARHGRRFDPPWTVNAPTAPPRPPDRLGAHRRTLTPPRRGRFTQPPWPQATPSAPPPFVPTMVRTRRRLAVSRRGCFWRWSIFQATQPAVTDLPDLSAVEALSGRRTAAEAPVGQLDAQETALARRTAHETPTGRVIATETTLDGLGT